VAKEDQSAGRPPDQGNPESMKFVEPSHFTDPDTAARKLVGIANAAEAVQDGRIFIERVNGPFLAEGGTPGQYRAALERAIQPPTGAELFACTV
jgi:hypothetical protein